MAEKTSNNYLTSRLAPPSSIRLEVAKELPPQVKKTTAIESTNRDISGLVDEAIAIVTANLSGPEIRIENALPQRGDRFSLPIAEVVPVITSVLALAVQLCAGNGRIIVEDEHVMGKRHDDKCDFIRIGIRIPGLSVVRYGFDMMIETVQNLRNLVSIESHCSDLGTLRAVENDIVKWGGNIWAKVEIGRGLTINFTVPLLRKAEPSSAATDTVTVVDLTAGEKLTRRLTDRRSR